MGLLAYDALVLSKAVEFLKKRDRCLTLGVPTLTFKPADFIQLRATRPDDFTSPQSTEPFEDAKGFFSTLGFATVDALDISDYEGANIVDDLNSPSLPDRVAGTYDLIYDSGTLEHIFDAPTALRSLVQLLSPGGVIVHATPANGFLDHGLWQVSPDLYRLFYGKAGFELLTSALFVFGADDVYAIPADENLYRTHGRKHVVKWAPEAIAVFAARKQSANVDLTISLQDYYADVHGVERGAVRSQFFLAYGTLPKFGLPAASQSAARLPFLSRIAASIGLCRGPR